MFRALTLLICLGLAPQFAFAGKIETDGCTNRETDMIKELVGWLKNNMRLLDDQMGRNNLMDWPGDSREKFVEKLDKDLKFFCINDKNKCKIDPDDKTMLLGQVVPVFAQKRVNLCTDNIRKAADNFGTSERAKLVNVIAHEIGHLIRINSHQNDCVKKYKEPRFSTAVGMAAEYAYRGLDYNYRTYTELCSE